MTTSAFVLLGFSPNGPEQPPAEPTPTLTFSLAVRLDGLRTATYTGSGLKANLAIPFGTHLDDSTPCNRAHFVGINPVGHAPLRLTSAKYDESTCGYLGPDYSFWVETDDPTEGQTLAIDWPQDNLYTFFDWPEAIIEYDPPLKPGETFLPQTETDLLNSHNTIRSGLGLNPPLVWDYTLQTAAVVHCRWLLEHHPTWVDGSGSDIPDGSDWMHVEDGEDSTGAQAWDRAWAAGYPTNTGAGENMGMRQRTVSEMMLGWMDSPSHHANIVNSNWLAMGGCALPIPGLPGRFIWCVVYGTLAYDTKHYHLVLEDLRDLSGTTEPDIGVQLPMRLVVTKSPDLTIPGDWSERILQEQIYEDAPGFTGSGTRVTVKAQNGETGPAWSVKSKDFATFVDNVYGNYSLYWRIYHGGGDMVYKAVCNGSELPETYVDRLTAFGGGFGVFDTTDYLAARATVAPRPYPFILNRLTLLQDDLVAGGQYNTNADGDIREFDDRLFNSSHDYWVGSDETVVSWSGVSIYIGGRLALGFSTTVACACLITDALERECLQLLVDTGTEAVIVRLPMYVRSTIEIVARCDLPSHDVPEGMYLNVAGYMFGYIEDPDDPVDGWYIHQESGTVKPNQLRYSFSQDGKFLLAIGHDTPTVVWESEITETVNTDEETGEKTLTVTLNDFSEIIAYDFNDTATTTEATILYDARYDVNDIVLRYCKVRGINADPNAPQIIPKLTILDDSTEVISWESEAANRQINHIARDHAIITLSNPTSQGQDYQKLWIGNDLINEANDYINIYDDPTFNYFDDNWQNDALILQKLAIDESYYPPPGETDTPAYYAAVSRLNLMARLWMALPFLRSLPNIQTVLSGDCRYVHSWYYHFDSESESWGRLETKSSIYSTSEDVASELSADDLYLSDLYLTSPRGCLYKPELTE